MRRGIGLWAAALAVYAFLYLPLTIVVVYSFNDSRLNAEWVGFTWHWYQVLLNDKEMLLAAGNSLFIALVSSLTATLLGTMAGIAMPTSSRVLGSASGIAALARAVTSWRM